MLPGLKDNFLDIESATKKLSIAIKPHLSPRHFKAFNMLFIQNCTEEEVAKYLGFKKVIFIVGVLPQSPGIQRHFF